MKGEWEGKGTSIMGGGGAHEMRDASYAAQGGAALAGEVVGAAAGAAGKSSFARVPILCSKLR